MTLYDRRVYLMPYEMTTRLMDELNNLRLKPTGVQNQFKVERISTMIEKDRFSALEYGNILEYCEKPPYCLTVKSKVIPADVYERL